MTVSTNKMETLGRIAVRVLMAMGVITLVAGCSSMERADAWLDRKWVVQSNMHEPEQTAIAVRRAEASATVTFAPRSAALGPDQRDGLARFVAASGAVQGDRALILMSPAPNRAIAERRVHTIARELHRQGLRVARSFGPGTPDTAVITISRLVAVPPDCPEWSQLMRRGEVSENRPRFGCIHASSLAVTVHSPQDLVTGRPSGPSDAQTLDRGLQQLREGKYDPSITGTGTGSPQSGTSGAK
jgi:pilus biogenesis lipoprotein CpaD